MPKVIAVDNYDRDSVSDRLIEDRLTETHAVERAEQLNRETGANASWFFKAVPDDYELHKWEP